MPACLKNLTIEWVELVWVAGEDFMEKVSCECEMKCDYSGAGGGFCDSRRTQMRTTVSETLLAAG